MGFQTSLAVTLPPAFTLWAGRLQQSHGAHSAETSPPRPPPSTSSPRPIYLYFFSSFLLSFMLYFSLPVWPTFIKVKRKTTSIFSKLFQNDKAWFYKILSKPYLKFQELLEMKWPSFPMFKTCLSSPAPSCCLFSLPSAWLFFIRSVEGPVNQLASHKPPGALV